MEDYSVLSIKETIKKLNSAETGISPAQAEKRLKEYGKNSLTGERHHGFIFCFFKQMCDFSIIILLIAAAISFLISYLSHENDYTDTFAILAIVVINAFIGALQEKKAEKSLKALKKLSSPVATVMRNSKEIKIPAEMVVPGDILILNDGDMVSADARIISATGLKADESALTGESVPCEKASVTLTEKNRPTAEKNNLVFSSTLIVSGHGKAVVTATGMNTEIGKIADMLNEKDDTTPLQKRLAALSKYLGYGALVCCVLIFLIGVLRQNDILSSFMLAVSLAVAAIPEGLPAIVTIVLSRGVGKLASEGAVIRHLPSCETLGNATVICSDKTGTLTQNKMTVTEVRLPFSRKSSDSQELLNYAALCTNCSKISRFGKTSVSGDPTEVAIVNAAVKNGFDLKTSYDKNKRLKEIPFDSTRKMMTTIHRNKDSYIVITKGSLQHVLKKCSFIKAGNTVKPLTQQHINEIEKLNNDMALKALRVLAVAIKTEKVLPQNPESDLIFLGLIGMEDPPRREVAQAVKKCRDAGITPVMITGDQLLTAKVIATKLGIFDNTSKAVDGNMLDRLSDDELRQEIKSIRVFARVTPEHKMRIVKILKEMGETVAMTGDGVNDAPALKAADIGCAMGKNGTEVAKNASDLVLTDDNFATIVNAVSIGRGLFDNIKKSVRFLLSCNIGEIVLIFIASVFGFSAPLLPVQLLWLNLVTDSLPAMALGVEKEEDNIMTRKPTPKSEGIITKTKAFDIVVEGLLFGVIALIAFILGKNMFSLETGRTMAFCTLSLSELFHAFNVRSEKSIFTISPFSNPQLLTSTLFCIALQICTVIMPFANEIFETTPLSATQWIIVALLSTVSLIVTETEKLIERKKQKIQELHKITKEL
ncbi:MAG: calcium-translocating P-type ATPase, PMCA-type [Clostridia bacterium]|nr:calcium-translocating P-type ATPase, PMCA-type [Clostridia bacterium]